MKNKLHKVTWPSGFSVFVINADENKVLKQLESAGIVTLEEIGTFKTMEELNELKKKSTADTEKKGKEKK